MVNVLGGRDRRAGHRSGFRTFRTAGDHPRGEPATNECPEARFYSLLADNLSRDCGLNAADLMCPSPRTATRTGRSVVTYSSDGDLT